MNALRSSDTTALYSAASSRHRINLSKRILCRSETCKSAIARLKVKDVRVCTSSVYMWGTGGNVCAFWPPHEAETSSFPRTCPIGYSPRNSIWVPRNLGPTAFFAVEKIPGDRQRVPPPSSDILRSSPIVGESVTSCFPDRVNCVNQSARKCERFLYIKLCSCVISHRYIIADEEKQEEIEVTWKVHKKTIYL
ncbi:uncharacterized protein LOC112458662 [Temnothorax curvispinosus]|uniref:Uncharacterized protein LOC112458662 n=1 Tax=Temnothorax curvispinosus TaxID=300111 RepID=A0A6J1Q7G7_9HYME|nr:uncharacterized protein LOC112458662 [Temnothorax curvispinosus]